MTKTDKEITSVNQNKNTTFIQSQSKLLKIGLFVAFFIVLILYFCTSVSKTNAVIIQGTHYLSDSYIQDISGIDQNDIYYFNIPIMKEIKLKSDPMIEDADVKLLSNRTISITITEKKAYGYRYEDDTAYILLSDNTKAELKSEYLDIIASVPLITGFEDDEQTRLLSKAFEQLDRSIIESISEISQYSTSYDDEILKILMRNGSYFLGTYQNLDKLNQYYAIYSSMNDKTLCISADDNTSTAYTMVCPWNDTAAVEYWTDENGNPIENSYGDKIVKHYYTDEAGNAATDENGNQIPIPIDENGSEVIDPNFNSNYQNGYYSSGSLVLPEGVTNEPVIEETEEPVDENDMPE